MPFTHYSLVRSVEVSTAVGRAIALAKRYFSANGQTQVHAVGLRRSYGSLRCRGDLFIRASLRLTGGSVCVVVANVVVVVATVVVVVAMVVLATVEL